MIFLASCAVDGVQQSNSALFDADLADAGEQAVAGLFDNDGAAMAKGVDDLRTLRVERDELGGVHTHVQQLLGGVPVWGGEAIVHRTPSRTSSTVTDDFVADVQVDTSPDFDAGDAIEVALAATSIGWDAVEQDPETDLWVIRRDGEDHLAWRVQIRHLPGTAADSMPVVFVDAHTNEIVWAYNNMQSDACTGTTNFYGTVTLDCYVTAGTYYLENVPDLVATYSYNHTTTSLYYVSNTTGTFDTTSIYKNAVEAEVAMEATNDYYDVTFGRNGINGSGGPAAVTSHGYSFMTGATSYSNNYVNAFWDPTNLMMVYGDGDGVNSGSLTTLDIAGHEITHGVTQYTAGLTYSGESGGLNESMSDVMGAMVERYATGSAAKNWQVGEDTWTPATSGDALRYMNDPAADGYSYDYYSSSIASADVHYTSGVGNLAYYLASEGGTHPRGKSTTAVTGIGSDAAAQIWYKALTSYMTSSTNYAGARTATLSAAAAIYGSTSTQYTQVGNAWTAVGVAGSSSTCTTSAYSGSFSKSSKSVYLPSSSGSSVTVSAQTVAMTGPSSTNFDVYLQKLSGRSWSTVASGTGSTSTENISYTGTSGTYRVYATTKSGTGTYAINWCK